jgi:hypothetical protein
MPFFLNIHNSLHNQECNNGVSQCFCWAKFWGKRSIECCFSPHVSVRTYLNTEKNVFEIITIGFYQLVLMIRNWQTW